MLVGPPGARPGRSVKLSRTAVLYRPLMEGLAKTLVQADTPRVGPTGARGGPDDTCARCQADLRRDDR